MQKRKQFTNNERQTVKDVRIWIGWALVIINAIILFMIIKYNI